MNAGRRISSVRARRRRGTLAVLVAVALPAVGASLPAACTGSGVDVVLSDVAGLRKSAAFAEILVYDQACPSLDLLSRGVEGSPKVRRVAGASGDLPDLGDLPQGPHGVAALLRDEGCAVIASGCADADFSTVRRVVVPLGAVVPPQGPCAGGATCVDAACVGGNDAGKADAGTVDAGTVDAGAADAGGDAGHADASAPDAGGSSCTLAVVKAGPLPGLVDASGGTMTGPGVTATEDGFLVAYREGTHDGASASAALLHIGDDGKVGLPSRQPLPTCPGAAASDGVGVAESGGSGLVVVSRAACAPAGAGLTILAFDAAHQLGAAAASVDLGAAVSVPRSQALTARKGGFDAALVVDGVAQLASIGAGSITKQAYFAEGTTSRFAGVAQTSATRATFADRPNLLGGETVLTMTSLDPPVGDAGALAALVAVRPPSAWGALAAWTSPSADRAAAVTLEPNGAIAWGAVDRDGTTRGAGSVPAGDGSAYAAGDVAVIADRLLVALAEPAGLRVQRLVGARGVALSAEGLPVPIAGAGVVALAAFDGARVAIAAARNRVLVVWVTKNELGPTDPTGGYAILACGD